MAACKEIQDEQNLAKSKYTSARLSRVEERMTQFFGAVRPVKVSYEQQVLANIIKDVYKIEFTGAD